MIVLSASCRRQSERLRMDKVRLCVISPDRFIHTKKVRPGLGSVASVKIQGRWCAYLVPQDLYDAGQRDFFYRMDDPHPLDLSTAQVSTSTINTLISEYSRVAISVNRAGRLELLKALQGKFGSSLGTVQPGNEPTAVVKIPEAGFMFNGTLEELAKAIEDVENGKVD